MPLTWDEIRGNALRFANRWKDASNEEAQAQAFLMDFLRVFGVDDPESTGDFEYKVPLEDGHTGYIDYLWKNHIAIEMKSRGKDLGAAYTQLKNYVFHLPAEEMPDLLMVCDFETIVLYQRNTGTRKQLKLKELHKNIRRYANIAGYETTREIEEQIEVNVKAAEKMAKLHDALKSHGYDGHELEVYLVRLLFCLFADDTGIFPRQSLHSYLENSREDGSDLSERIARLFDVLNMPDDKRARRDNLPSELRQFRYINGGLFSDRLSHADFDEKMRRTLLDCSRFDWNEISPAIFGAMFQGVMDKKQRRELGAHYTSEENILKLVNPLFLDDLWEEFEHAKTHPAQLDRFHDKISGLKFLDPACGCGNFLIITYRELRRLELEVLKMKVNSGQKILDITPLLKVNVEQFYGIEYEDFPCQIAQVGMWLTDHQMNMKTAEMFGMYCARLPLKQSATIVRGNALQIDWESVVPKRKLNYILGNPPFNGARLMAAAQKRDILSVFGDMKGVGNLDYVTAWYKKAADMMAGTHIRTAFVSTNSVSQGEQVALLWEPLFQKQKVHIDFAYRTFKWSNEAKGKAAVHCVIIGFSTAPIDKPKHIIDSDGRLSETKHINAYLVDAPDIFIHSRTKPICDVPEIGIGNKPIDGGNYLFTEDEKTEFLKIEPRAEKWFRPWIGSHEFINRYYRYCLWLGDCSPAELRAMPEAMKRIEAVKRFRLSSKSEGTRRLAATPTRFHVENMPANTYIVIPEVSSERRNYIPIGFLTPDILCSNLVKIVPDATLYHFGVLTSSVHNAWMRAVCGRLKSDYRYSKDIVYNNFPWPEPTEAQKATIETAAQGILDARALFPDSSLADLYDPLTMPPQLSKAHHNLDNVVMKAYGFSGRSITEVAIVADMMARYHVLATRTE